MDVKVSNQINNNSLQESGVNTLTSSQICGGYFNKGFSMSTKESVEWAKTKEEYDFYSTGELRTLLKSEVDILNRESMIGALLYYRSDNFRRGLFLIRGRR